MRIALAGNPNSGKTTMYNALTGSTEKVGNWAGVTVDKKEHSIKGRFAGGRELIAVDLPGAYSMSPFTSEESVTRDYVKNERPDVIINIVDSVNLSRSLFFTTQLLELGIPMVVALNKSDANEKKGNKIDTDRLSAILGCPVVSTVSTSRKGLSELVSAAAARAGESQAAPYKSTVGDNCGKADFEEDDRKRFAFVDNIIREVEIKGSLTSSLGTQDKIDSLLTNRWLGIPIFAAVMFMVFWISQAGPGVWIADLLVGLLESGQAALSDVLQSDSVWTSLLIDGIIGGFIAIIGFLPLVMVMYFLIDMLEDCGYMARATVVLDPIFKKVGLSGKSVIPFVIGTGCAIPGVMACRTIRNEREKRATAMIAPFMPCGAKLPVITLFARVFFADAWWVGPIMYFVGILIILGTALIVNGITGNRKKHSYFIIELPEYKLPSIRKAALAMCQRGWSYVVKAGTVILVCNFVVHLMQNFTWAFTPVAEGAADTSILASVAKPFAYIFAPIIGYVSWQLAAATITGFIAKENVVATLAVSFSITNLINPDEMAAVPGAGGADIAAVFGMGSGGSMLAVAGLAYLILNLFSPPCFAAIGAMNSELGSKKWLFAGIGLQLSVGYSLGFLTNFFGRLFTGAPLGSTVMNIAGFAFVLSFAAVCTVLTVRNNKRIAKEAAAKAAREAQVA